MELTPYKGLSSEPIIRYLYTGREYNIETGDYYYRARIYDQSVGRFGGKDSNKCQFNMYCYSMNNPMKFADPLGESIETAFADWISERIDKAHEEALNNGLMRTDEDEDDFKHCYGACIMTPFFGIFGTMAIQWYHEGKDDSQDSKEDNIAAQMGIIYALQGKNCRKECTKYSNRKDFPLDPPGNYGDLYDDDYNWIRKTIPGEASQQDPSR